jgi:hypothetical protein
MVGHGEGVTGEMMMKDAARLAPSGALLYHPPRPCANAAKGVRMNKPWLISFEHHHG